MDQLHRFLLENLDIRGAVVRLEDSWRAMQEERAYAPAVSRLLGEMTAVTVIIAGQLKSPGRLGFQLKGDESIQLLLIDCDETLRLRGMARANNQVIESTARQLLGQGQLIMTLDMPEMLQPFQSFVPLQGESIAEIFQHYLEQSEQQPALLLLASNEQQVRGLFLQKMPGADSKDEDGWERVCHLLKTVKTEELLNLDTETMLTRLFHQEDVRLYEGRTVAYHCPEDWPKIRTMLRNLGAEELRAILDEQGEILVKDEICHREYRLDAAGVEQLLNPSSDHTLH